MGCKRFMSATAIRTPKVTDVAPEKTDPRARSRAASPFGVRSGAGSVNSHYPPRPAGWHASHPTSTSKTGSIPALRDDPAVTWEESEAFRVSRLAREPETFQHLQSELTICCNVCEILQDLATVSHARHDYRVALVEAESLFQSIQGTLFGGSIRGLLVQFGSPAKNRSIPGLSWTESSFKIWLPSITGQATSMMPACCWVSIMTVAMFYFLADGSAMNHAVMRLSSPR